MGNGEWEYAKEVPANLTEGTVDGLIEGKQYQFRIKAVNKAGPGEPSDVSSRNITCNYGFGLFYID